MNGYGLFAIYLAGLGGFLLYEWVECLRMRSKARREIRRDLAVAPVPSTETEPSAEVRRVYPSPFEWASMLPEPTVGDPKDWQAWTEEMQG